MPLFLIVVLGVVFLLLLYTVAIYNKLSTFKVRIEEAWAQIDVQLKRRVDLIPNLVETVKGYAAHEKEVFDKVLEARSKLMGANSREEKGEADQVLTATLKSLFALAEAYPDLKAQEGFVNLQNELSDTEDKVSYSRQFYNSVVRDYNQLTVVLPSSLIAGALGFKKQPFFEVQESEREAVKVDF